MKVIDELTGSFICNGWRWEVIFKQDGIAVAQVEPDNGQATRASGFELAILRQDGRWPSAVGTVWDYGFEGRDAALATAEELVKFPADQRPAVASNLYSRFRNNILYGYTNASQWGAAPVVG